MIEQRGALLTATHSRRAAVRRRAGEACLLLLLAHAVAGCGGTAVEHAEEPHVRPSHHPGSFRGAVAAIDSRTTALNAGPLDAAAAERAVRELADIVGWLPELAAETELSRREWDRVHAVSRGLGKLLEPVVSRPAAGIGPEVRTSLRDSLAILEAAAASLHSDSREEDGP
jgi:hypothetical protein